jgi:D-glycero-D-manno-heptose 1,7-bisphosphate phosphatase
MKAVFVDRDGTMIVEPPNERLTWIHDIKLFPDTIEALKLLQDNGFAIIEVTNQAGIGEGLITIEKFWDMEIGGVEKMLAEGGVKITKTFVCPHTAADNCECRKPKPKMLLDAAKEFNIDLASSFMIGDRLGDIGAGQNAGAKTILVKTGAVPVEAPDATYTAENLLEAAHYVVENS